MAASSAVQLETGSAEHTEALAAALAALLRPGDVVALHGELGAGKTCFVRGLARALGVADPVTSPTFTLIHEYGRNPKVYHIDFYRLDRLPELETLGLDDLWAQEAIVLIEWGEKFDRRLPPERLEIHLEHAGGDRRRITVVG